MSEQDQLNPANLKSLVEPYHCHHIILRLNGASREPGPDSACQLNTINNNNRPCLIKVLVLSESTC